MILKIVVRNLLKRPALNIIKVAGLSLALTGFMLISLFLKNEVTFDAFHKNSDRIYRLTIADSANITGKHFARVSNPGFVPEMADYFPGIENFVRLVPVRGGVIKYRQEYIPVNQAFECDSTFFGVFDAKLLTGNPETILNSPGSLVISESFAEKIFGNSNPVGQILTLPGGQFYGRDIDFTIKGLMKDFPQNSHFHPDFITTPVDRSVFMSWAWTYILLSKNADPSDITKGFRDFYKTRAGNSAGEAKIEANLQIITDIHLHSSKLREIENNGNMSTVYTLSAAAVILLIIALANYANLNSGMAYYNEKFLFISRVSGASTGTTLKYFIAGGTIIVFASVALSAFLLVLADVLIQKNLSLALFKGNIPLILTVIVLFSLLSIISGILLLLKQLTNNIISSYLRSNKNRPPANGVSKTIIVLQYAMAIALIASVIVIRRQTVYAMGQGMGAGSEDLICFKDLHTVVQQKFEVFKEELLKYNSFEYISAMFEPPGGEANDMFQFRMEGQPVSEKNTDNYIGVFPCDYSFASIFKLNFLAGNNFSETNEDNEGSGEYIINESAMRRLNFTDPGGIIGKEFRLLTNIDGIDLPDGKITGVVEDFHLSGIKKKIEPLVMFKRKDLWLLNFVISFRPGMRNKALSDLDRVWKEMFPGYPMQYTSVSSLYSDIYKSERLQGTLLATFTLISLFICSMGLLGMSLLITRRRTKEIGLRKISGATIWEIIILLNRDLIKWIIISFLIAAPVTFIVMGRWLENFAYRISPGWLIFLLSGLVAVLTALLTVSVLSWKAASANPVEALRYE